MQKPFSKMAERSSRARNRLLGAATAALSIIAVAAIVLAVQGFVNAANESDSSSQNPATQSTRVETGAVIKSVQGSVATVPQASVTLPNLLTVPAPQLFTRAGAVNGTTLNNGTVIATIVERPIIALVSTIPFYRPLAVGTTGPDVTALQNALASLGYSSTDPSGTYGIRTARATSP